MNLVLQHLNFDGSVFKLAWLGNFPKKYFFNIAYNAPLWF